MSVPDSAEPAVFEHFYFFPEDKCFIIGITGSEKSFRICFRLYVVET